MNEVKQNGKAEKMNYILLTIFCAVLCKTASGGLPLVINTWDYRIATTEAWSVLKSTGNPLDALVEGINACERDGCNYTVGYGGKPDENGETTLDSMIMDGSNLNMGAVANLREIKYPIKVAKYVLLHTRHSLLSGNQATEFAQSMGFVRESLDGKYLKKKYINWLKNKCQPNYWNNVVPDPRTSCGPYRAEHVMNGSYYDYEKHNVGSKNHDTIGMIVINKKGQIFAGTSTNGVSYKIPGRIGDSAIPGSGAYCNNKYGAASATGQGDILMRHLPSFLAVELLRNGHSPQEAADKVVRRMIEHYPQFNGAVIVADKDGNYGASCNNMESGDFPFSVADKKGVRIEWATCIS